MNHREVILRDFFEAVWNSGDADAVDRFLTDGYTIHHDPGDPWHGQTLDREGFKARLNQSRAPFPDQRFAIQDCLVADDRIAVIWYWQGTYVGGIPGFPDQGQHIQTSGITVYYFEGDRLSGHWQNTDRLAVYQQLQGG